jgi:hypothetical protein
VSRPRTTYTIPQSLATRLRAHLEATGSTRRKSDWICKALLDLRAADPVFATVGVGEGMEASAEPRGIDPVRLTPAAADVIDEAISCIRNHDPHQEGIQSAVIRAAIRHALAREAQQPGRA